MNATPLPCLCSHTPALRATCFAGQAKNRALPSAHCTATRSTIRSTVTSISSASTPTSYTAVWEARVAVEHESHRDCAVDVRELSAGYNSHTALDGVTFTIERGCLAGLVGPNGSGKSTLLKVMLGL